jgi:hypothetical protein
VETSGTEVDGEDGAPPKQINSVAAAYNQSIYIMLVVPYALLGVFGFMIYRGMRKNETYRVQQQPAPVGETAPER